MMTMVSRPTRARASTMMAVMMIVEVPAIVSGAARATGIGEIRTSDSTDFLRSIWAERPMELTTSMQTSLVLTNLLRSRKDWRSVVAVLRGIYRRRFGRDAALDNYMLGWLQGHFLVPFAERSLPLADLVEG